MVYALIAVEQRKEPCWRVNCYSGSMLTFDLGFPLDMQTSRGEPIKMGRSTIGVRRIWWCVDGPALEPFCSNDLDTNPNLWLYLDAALQGADLISCRRCDEGTILGFSNHISLELDGNNSYEAEPDEVVMSLRLSGGAYFEMTPDGVIRLDLEESLRKR